MPDSYTHVHIAFHALLRAHLSAASLPCYFAGANGSDVLCHFKPGKQTPSPNLPALSEQMQKEKTGLFLTRLIAQSLTTQQQSYTMGYLTHYAACCILNPYITALGDAGLFKGRAGRLSFEASLDSELFYQNHRRRIVPPYAATPILLNEDLAQVSKLLQDAVFFVYKQDIDAVHFADAFHDNMRMRKKMVSAHGLHKLWAKRLYTLLYGRKRSEDMVSRMQPGAALPLLPQQWKDPYTLQKKHMSLEEVLALSVDMAASVISAAMQYWLLEIDEAELATCLGNKSYHTGQPLGTTEASPAIQETTPFASTGETIENKPE